MATTIRKHYDQLLLDNISAVSTIESGIRNVTWLLPGRFQDAEVASEGCELTLTLQPRRERYTPVIATVTMLELADACQCTPFSG